jgi:hypothetical protein
MTLDLETRPVGTPVRLRPPEQPPQTSSVPAPTATPTELAAPPPVPEPVVDLAEAAVTVTLPTVSRPAVNVSAEPPATSYWVRRRRAEAAAKA